jgi:hypothetical protein
MIDDFGPSNFTAFRCLLIKGIEEGTKQETKKPQQLSGY